MSSAPPPRGNLSLDELLPELKSLVIRKTTARALVHLSATNRFFRQKCLEEGGKLLAELWTLAQDASWMVRAQGADAMHLLALFTGRRPMVPAGLFDYFRERLQDYDTMIRVDVGALERVYLIFGDVLTPFNRGGIHTGRHHPVLRGRWMIAEDAMRRTFDDFCRAVVCYAQSQYRHCITTSDIAEATAFTLRRMKPMGTRLTFEDDHGLYAEGEPHLIAMLTEPAEEFLNECVVIEGFNGDNDGLRGLPERFKARRRPAGRGTKYPAIASFFEDPHNFACNPDAHYRPDVPLAPEDGPVHPWFEFAAGNKFFWRDPWDVLQQGADPPCPCGHSFCCHMACNCCSSSEIFETVYHRLLEGPEFQPLVGAPYPDTRSDFWDRMTQDIYELTLEATRRHSQGPLCPWVREQRLARKRFADWRKMGQGPGGRAWIERMGLQVRRE